MRTLSLWQLLLSLFFTAQSFPDWNFVTQTSDVSTSGSMVDNGLDTFNVELATTEGASELAQVPDDGNELNIDASKVQGSGCPPDTNRLSGQRRTRRGNVCPPNRLELNNGESGRQSAPTMPTLQQNQRGQNSDDGSGQPRPKIILPKADDPLPDIFWPEERRPKMDPERCYEKGYFIPVCAKDSDAFIAPGAFGTYILDPCNPYFPLAACLPNEHAYCCLMTAVAYKQTSRELLAPFQNLGTPPELDKIQEALRYHENPFKLIGVTCIPMAEGPDEIKIPDHAF